MIVFELSMPHVGSWNNKWSGKDNCYIRVRNERAVPKEVWGKNFEYRWDDGWCANVSVTRLPAKEARKLEKKSVGFYGYDWMIKSIIEHGEIREN